jgi:hypothetical protein
MSDRLHIIRANIARHSDPIIRQNAIDELEGLGEKAALRKSGHS